MRWAGFLILMFATVVVQATLGTLLRFRLSWVDSVGPDLLALLAVFIAMYCRTAPDAMLAAWVLGLALDLTAAGGPPGRTVLGPMPLGYVAAAALVFHVRGVFMRETVLAQMVLGLLFCLTAHGLWVTIQSLAAGGGVAWLAWRQMIVEALALALYTALLMPAGHFLLSRGQRLFLAAPPSRSRRG